MIREGWSSGPQREGDLLQGALSDIEDPGLDAVRQKYTESKFRILHVGTQPLGVPKWVRLWEHYPMPTFTLSETDWRGLIGRAGSVLMSLLGGTTVLVTCDYGTNRSVVVAGMVVSLLDGVPMDEALMDRLTTGPIAPDYLWWQAAERVEVENRNPKLVELREGLQRLRSDVRKK